MAADKAADRQEVRFKLIYQILISMLVISLVPLGGLWYISIHKAKQEWTTNIRQNLVNNTEHLTRSVDEWTAMNLRLLEQNASTPAVLGMEAAAQNRVMKSITDVYSWIYLAFTVSPDGQNPGRSDGKPPTFYGDRDYVKQVLAGKPFGQQVLLGKTSNKPAFILAKPIKGDAGKAVGVMAIAMTLEDLSKSITKTRIGETGFALLLDEQNRLIAHGRGEVTSELQDFSAHPALKRSGRPDPDSFVFVEGDKKIVAFSQKTNLGWTLIVQQDYREAYAAADAAQRNAILLLIATLIAVVAIAYLLAHRLSAPIRNLTAIADEISRGNLGAEISECGRSDEIGALARAIQRMGVSLQMAFDRLRKR